VAVVETYQTASVVDAAVRQRSDVAAGRRRPRVVAGHTIPTSDCNPGIDFSIPRFGIKNFVILESGFRD